MQIDLSQVQWDDETPDISQVQWDGEIPTSTTAPAIPSQPSNGLSPGVGYQPAMPAGGRPGLLKGLAGVGEGALSIASGIPASLAGGATYMGALGTTFDPAVAQQAMSHMQEGLTYQPRTQAGQQVRGLFDTAMGKAEQGTDIVGERTAEQYGSLAGAFQKTGMNALLMALGGKTSTSVKPNLFNKPAGTLALLGGNVEKIAGNNMRAAGGPEQARIALANQAQNYRQTVPGVQTTAAEAVSGIPEGNVIQALQQKLSRTQTVTPVGNTGLGVSQAFNKQWQDNAASRLQAKVALRANEGAAMDVAKSNAAPVPVVPLFQKINQLITDPANVGSKVAAKALNDVRDHLLTLTDAQGNVVPQALHKVRMELGSYIKSAMGENKNWDKKLAARLQRDIQLSIDDAMENAGATNWKQAVADYAKGAEKISFDTLRDKYKYKTAQPSISGSTRAAVEESGVHIPQLWSRLTSIPSAILKNRKLSLEDAVAAKQAEMLFNPQQLSDVLMKGLTPAERAAALARRQSLDRARSLAVGGGVFGQSSQ